MQSVIMEPAHPRPDSPPSSGWSLEQALQALQAQQRQGTRLHWLAVARLLQAAQPERHALGQGVRIDEDALAVHHTHVFGFATREVSAVSAASGKGSSGRAILMQDAVGLLGPNGPLPYAWTQYLFELSRPDAPDGASRHGESAAPLTSRLAQERANSFLAFINLLQRRHLALFVRAWMDTRAETAFDPGVSPGAHPLSQRLSALAGLPLALEGRAPPADALAGDSIPDDFKRAYASVMARRVRSPLPLAAMLSRHLDVAARVEEFAPRWIRLERRDRTRLGRAHARLGQQAMLGDRSWDARQSFRVLLGPMDAARYQDFLPGRPGWRRARDLVATALGAPWHWELVPLLAHEAIPAARLTPAQGAGAALGHTAWLGQPRTPRPAADLVVPMQAALQPDPVHLAR
ncbi:MAG: type VI secretion system baseplate subunit TssG [Rubrivivax sp.]